MLLLVGLLFTSGYLVDGSTVEDLLIVA